MKNNPTIEEIREKVRTIGDKYKKGRFAVTLHNNLWESGFHAAKIEVLRILDEVEKHER